MKSLTIFEKNSKNISKAADKSDKIENDFFHLNFYVKLNWKWNLELEFKNFEGKLQKSWIILLFFAFEFCSTIQQHWYKLRRLSHYQSKRKLRNGNHATSFRYFTHFKDSVSQINWISLIFRQINSEEKLQK